MTSPVILISDNLRSEKIDCACQLVEVDLLGSTLEKIVFFIFFKDLGATEAELNVIVTESENNTLLTDEVDCVLQVIKSVRFTWP